MIHVHHVTPQEKHFDNEIISCITVLDQKSVRIMDYRATEKLSPFSSHTRDDYLVRSSYHYPIGISVIFRTIIVNKV